MTPAEQNLRDFQAELVGLTQSVYEPGCVGRAFCTGLKDEAFVFTMQAWIDLSVAHSPLLELRLPDPEENVLEVLLTAFRAFDRWEARVDELEPEEAVTIGKLMIEAIRAGFAMQLKLQPPRGFTCSAVDDGMGNWLPTMAFLKSQMNYSQDEAARLPVGQAFGMMAAHRRNQGWTVEGETYAMRDLPDSPSVASVP